MENTRTILKDMENTEEWHEKVLETERKFHRVMAMRLVTPKKTYSIVSAYAPQERCDEEEKQEFWNQLARVLGGIGSNDELILAGDLNRHVGRERSAAFEMWHRGKTRGRVNSGGEAILDYAWKGDLALVNIF
eukprot:gene10281-11341_t